jgi:hypothetical protein
VTIGPGGFVDVQVVLTKGETQGGYNYITAVIQDPQGRTSDNAPNLVLKYNPGGSGAAAVTPSSDFDGNGLIDGNDFLMWQRGGTADELADWKSSFATSQLVASTDVSAATPEPLAVQATGDEIRARDAALAESENDSFIATLTHASPNASSLSRSALRGRRPFLRGVLLSDVAISTSRSASAAPILTLYHLAADASPADGEVGQDLSESRANLIDEFDAAFNQVG